MADSGQIVICSFISPYKAERDMVRGLIADDEFLEVFVDTPIEECARRDPKGLYSKAKAGKIKNFTGVDSPYQAPSAPDIHLRTVGQTPEQLAGAVVNALIERKIVGGVRPPPSSLTCPALGVRYAAAAYRLKSGYRRVSSAQPKDIELPAAVARAFVRDMRPFFEKNTIEADAIAGSLASRPYAVGVQTCPQ